jgi:hypothetical protein
MAYWSCRTMGRPKAMPVTYSLLNNTWQGVGGGGTTPHRGRAPCHAQATVAGHPQPRHAH